jgi:hypothetical protein
VPTEWRVCGDGDGYFRVNFVADRVRHRCGLHGLSLIGERGRWRYACTHKEGGCVCELVMCGVGRWVRHNVDGRDGRGWPASMIVEIRENWELCDVMNKMSFVGLDYS